MSENHGLTRSYGAFFILGIAFIVLGVTTNRAFLGVGAAFIVIGLAGLSKSPSEPEGPESENDQG
jgi:hypothetical protein